MLLSHCLSLCGLPSTRNYKQQELRRAVAGRSAADADEFLAVTCECRALVLEVPSWRLVAKGLDRFFNFAEPLPAALAGAQLPAPLFATTKVKSPSLLRV
jgi:hypothetical protein